MQQFPDLRFLLMLAGPLNVLSQLDFKRLFAAPGLFQMLTKHFNYLLTALQLSGLVTG
ncbi:hypothetical protein D3C86_2172990 [compost metagenome]